MSMSSSRWRVRGKFQFVFNPSGKCYKIFLRFAGKPLAWGWRVPEARFERKLPGLIATHSRRLKRNEVYFELQIIIEAISGQTRLSDIAFDDVSILSDGECLEADDDGKAQEMGEDGDNDGVFAVDSCVNRCFEDKNTTVQLDSNNSLSCSCSRDCDPKSSCCPDYIGP